MILGVVFSRDRAMQLEAMLASFHRHAADAASVRLVVLYRTSSPRHHGQYAELEREFATRVHFTEETSFRLQLREILTGASVTGRGRSRSWWSHAFRPRRAVEAASADRADYILFLVDDTIFVRPFDLRAATSALAVHPEAAGFSLRLGRNTTRCYVLSRPQALPAFEILPNGVLKFDWTKGDGDFGYPLEVSSSLYALETVQRLLHRLPFSDPNTLESRMSLEGRRLAHAQPALLCFPTSVAFSVPLNRVQEVFENRASSAPISPDMLADMYERGQRIDITALDTFVPSSCHQEVQLDFPERAAR